MSELIRKPRAKVDRRLVQAAVLRLARYPETTSLGTVMRMVDEYAASQHTELVHRHAERIVAQALIDAAAVGDGEKIFVCDSVAIHEKIFSENFFREEKIFIGKNFFYQGSCTCADASTPTRDQNPTNPISPDCLNSTTCPTCATCLTCPICPVTGATDTSGPTTPVPDTSDSATPATDTRDTGEGVTGAPDKGGLATPATGTEDSSDAMVRAPIDCALLSDGPMDDMPSDGVRTVDASTLRPRGAAPKVDMATHEDGRNNPEGGAPDAPGKRCTQCGEWRQMSGYGLNRSRPDGHSSACRVCENARDERRREARRAAKEAQNGA